MRVYIYGTSLRGVRGVGTRTLYLDSRHEEQPDFPMTSICELIQAIFICYIVLRVLALGFARLFFFLHAFCLKTNTKQKQPLLHNFTIVIYSRIRHKPRDQKFWETSQNSFVMFPDFISNICTTKEPRKKKKKKRKSCLLHVRFFLELDSSISAQKLLLFTVQLLTTHQHSLFKSRLQLEVKTVKQPEMSLFQ